MVGQCAWGQDLWQLQATVHHYILGASCPAGTLGATIMLPASSQCLGPSFSFPQQGEQHEQHHWQLDFRLSGSTGLVVGDWARQLGGGPNLKCSSPRVGIVDSEISA